VIDIIEGKTKIEQMNIVRRGRPAIKVAEDLKNLEKKKAKVDELFDELKKSSSFCNKRERKAIEK